MKKIIPLFLALVFMALVSQAQTQKMKTWKGVPYRVSSTMLKGDANGDGLINMSDVTVVINYILGRNIDDFSFDNAELTGDGFINMSDVTAIINIILGRNVEKKPQAYLTCPDDNHPHLIDLGLPSGTKWACCDVGATTPERLGGLYAWGSIEEMTVPYEPYEPNEGDDWDDDWDSEDGESNQGILENPSHRINKTRKDNDENICGTERDVAHVKWGGAWQMPSEEQIRELCEYSTASLYSKRNEDEETWNDFILLSCPNGGDIIFPYYWGERSDDDNYFDYNENRYWSGTPSLNDNSSAWGLFLGFWERTLIPVGTVTYVSSEIFKFDFSSGASVRPIYNGESYGYLSLSTNVVNIGVGDSYEVSITSGTGNYRFTNTSSSIAEVTLSGSTISIIGKSAGSATVTVTDTASGISTEISVKVINLCPDSNHPHMIDLGLPSGTKWACCNVGAEKPEAEGGLYYWGRTEDSSSNYESFEDVFDNLKDLHDIGGTEYDVAHVKWGGDWRIPSCPLAEEMYNNCSHEDINYKGVSGMVFTGTNGNLLFLPYSDFYLSLPPEIIQSSPTKCGHYWTSTSDEDDKVLYDSYGHAVKCPYYIEMLDNKVSSNYYLIYDDSDDLLVRPIIKGQYLALSRNEVDIYYGESDKVVIASGSGNYTVSCPDTIIVDVSLDGSTVMIKAKAIGKASVIVTDMVSGMTADIIVAVSYRDLELDMNNVSMYCGKTTKVKIVSGNGNYTVSNTSPNIIDVSLDGPTITITGKDAGKATVTVTDTTSGMTADILVTVSYMDLLLSVNELAIFPGETANVNITSGNGAYSVSSSDPSIVDVAVDGSTIILAGKEKGIATIVVYDDRSGKTGDISVKVGIPCPDSNHPHLIDLGLPSGTKWACCNVGATTPVEKGGYYAWGETEEKDDYSWATYVHCDGTKETCHNLGQSISGTEYDVAYVKWGDAFQMPLPSQIQELASKCQFKELTYEGIKGKLVIGSNGNRLFIPYAGSRRDKSIVGEGDAGQYFSGTKQDPYYAQILLMNPNEVKKTYLSRSFGLTVRPVSK